MTKAINIPMRALAVADRLDTALGLSKQQKVALANRLFGELANLERDVRRALGGPCYRREVEWLVCLAIEHSQISEGRGAEILGIDLLEMRRIADAHCEAKELGL